jgi:hypothetical protein
VCNKRRSILVHLATADAIALRVSIADKVPAQSSFDLQAVAGPVQGPFKTGRKSAPYRYDALVTAFLKREVGTTGKGLQRI